MSDPEFLPMEILVERFGVSASTLAYRILVANRNKPGAVRIRGTSRFKEYAVEDVRKVKDGMRGTVRRRVG